MIKQKGVCDVCTGEFELNGGTFGVKVTQGGEDVQRTTVFIVHGAAKSPEGYNHVCGKACLYRMLDEHLDKGATDDRL